MCMKIDDSTLARIESDLGLNVKYYKGQENVPVRNCWHFCSDGRAVDTMFRDTEDFRFGMNLIPLLLKKRDVLILAFALMDTHFHFILYGERGDCDRFMHDYSRRLSIRIAYRHGERNKLSDVPINCQKIDTDSYLKTAIAYVLRNPYVAGLHTSTYDYPWSSCPLMFRSRDSWTSPWWLDSADDRTVSLGSVESKAFFKSHDAEAGNWQIVDGVVFPGQYVAYELAERVFRTHKAFAYHLGLSKETEFESMGGELSRLSIPDQEMREYRNEVCRRLFGTSGVRGLDTTQRIRLAKELKRLYNSSPKQIIRMSGLVYEEAKDLI